MKKNLSKFMMLLMLTVILTSPAVFATTLSTHINPIAPITCKQGDTVTVTAQLWTENYVDGIWDNPMGRQYLQFSLYSQGLGHHYNQTVLEKTEETKLWTGKATVNIDTKDIYPGVYILVVDFKGDSGLVADFKPCSTHTIFTVN